MKHVAIISSQPLLRLGLQHCLTSHEFALQFSEFETLPHFLVYDVRVDLALVDTRGTPPLSLPHLKVAAERIVLLTDVPGAYLVCLMMSGGFAGVLHFEDSPNTVRGAIANVLGGGMAVSRRVAFEQVEAMRELLPVRAAILMRDLALDRAIHETAESLGVSDEVAVQAKSDLRVRLGLASTRDLTAFALRTGLLTMQEFLDGVPAAREGRS